MDKIEALKKSPIQKVKVAASDIDGILRGKYIHKNKFLAALESGFGFCDVVFGWDSADVCYDNGKFTGWHTGYPDVQAKFDTNTIREIPWENNQPFLLADFPEAGVCPRSLLRSVIAKASKMGFSAKCGLEFEFFNFLESSQSWADKNFVKPQPLTPGMFGYSLLRSGQNQEYFSALMDEMEKFGVPLEGLHTETGPGVYEAAILYSDPLEAADRAILFKMGVKAIANRFGIMPSFMAKWDSKLPGCSGHIHQSLWEGDQSSFFDANNKHKMSKNFEHYLAGQMHCLPEILPFFAPNVNSYKRLVEGLWAPTKVAWGVENRTTAFRVIPGSKNSTRLETRIAGSDINPYLATAAALASGLYGIEKKLELNSTPVQGNAYELKDAPSIPANLHEATQKLKKSEIAKEIFGASFVEHFVATREWEWRQYQTAVTNWEMERYFEII